MKIVPLVRSNKFQFAKLLKKLRKCIITIEIPYFFQSRIILDTLEEIKPLEEIDRKSWASFIQSALEEGSRDEN